MGQSVKRVPFQLNAGCITDSKSGLSVGNPNLIWTWHQRGFALPSSKFCLLVSNAFYGLCVRWICEIKPRGFGKPLASRASFNNLKRKWKFWCPPKEQNPVYSVGLFLFKIMTVLVSGASLEGCTTHRLRDLTPPYNRPLCLCPYCWVPATVNGHLMILQGPFNWVENVQVGRAQPRLW